MKRDNDIIDALTYLTSTPSSKDSYFYDCFKREIIEACAMKPIWMGIDWVENSGCNRGDIISRNQNIIYVRFKTVEIQ